MDILTLELFDVTVSHALLEVRGALERHPGLPIRILVDTDEMLRLNLERFLQRQGRSPAVRNQGSHWQLDVPGGPAVEPAAVTKAFQPPPRAQEELRPVLLLRSAFAPGDRALGRHLLLGVLEALDARTPWLLLAHEALDLLEDPRARTALLGLQDRGIPVRLSQESLHFLGHSGAPFEPMEDADWQTVLGRGGFTVL
jgi:hypothetical protein